MLLYRMCTLDLELAREPNLSTVVPMGYLQRMYQRKICNDIRNYIMVYSIKNAYVNKRFTL